jgi:hypothetical protein
MIKYMISHLNETGGVPTIITNIGCLVEVRIYKLATFHLSIDESILTGYCAKLLTDADLGEDTICESRDRLCDREGSATDDLDKW